MPLDEATLAGSYTVEGPKTAPPLLFVHGIHLGRFSWLPHVQILRDRFRVITIDLPRHGTMVDVPFTRENLDCQLSYITSVALDRPPIIVGYSLGGYVAILLAHDHPERTQGLVICGTPLDPTGWRRFAFRTFLGMRSRLPVRFFEFGSSLFFKATLPRALAQTIIASPFDPRAFEEAYAAFSQLQFNPMLANYREPICAVNGQRDIFFRMETKKFARRERDILETIERTDHVFPLRRPKEFCDIVARFAQSVLGEPSPSSSPKS